ncbi:hypothetical protein XM47_03275 [Catenovulum maritimum]|uniref:SGNH hydrolase-type esterase domain-containing protein n=1 Tax=Catenovulum maritimum TaxID=1513271 RepID=A0A0J8JPQ1_9ALTE|nr:hypothetical protein XM47_03275 [Catenovulum maritimum]
MNNQTSNSEQTQQQKLMILGDSLSAGYSMQIEESWAHLLAQKWQKSAPNLSIINASVSGETTDGGLNRLPNLLKQHQPKWVLIELGGNDALRGFNLNLIKQNLINIVQLIKKNNALPIMTSIKIPPNYGKRYTETFTKQFSLIAAQENIPYFSFYLEEIALNPDLMKKDGIHPNEKAQPLIAEHVNKEINRIINLTL